MRVYSHSYWLTFFVQPIAAECWRGRSGKLLRILESLPPLPRQHSAAIGCTKNNQPIGVTIHARCVETLKVSYSEVGEGGVAVN